MGRHERAGGRSRRAGRVVPRPGAAGRAWRLALALCVGAAALLLVGLLGVSGLLRPPSGRLGDSAGWTLLALFAYGWVLAIAALAAWAMATGLAAAGRGTLPRPVLLLGAAAFVLGIIACLLSLRSTGAPVAVALALAACLLGIVASAAALLRGPPPAA